MQEFVQVRSGCRERLLEGISVVIVVVMKMFVRSDGKEFLGLEIARDGS